MAKATIPIIATIITAMMGMICPDSAPLTRIFPTLYSCSMVLLPCSGMVTPAKTMFSKGLKGYLTVTDTD
jgi:hypothetical protein